MTAHGPRLAARVRADLAGATRDLDYLERAAARSFRAMEDALASFVAGGRADFSAFADAAVADLARIALRQAVTAPLASALPGALAGAAGAGLAPPVPALAPPPALPASAAPIAASAGAPVTVAIENRGRPQRVAAADGAWDGRRWVLAVVTEDIDEGGAVARAVGRSFGLPGAVA